jgi:hypothetical protein
MKNSQFFSTLASVKNTALKMFMGVVFFFSLMSSGTAQTWDTNAAGKCFCCGDYYSLPTPPAITGPTILECGVNATYSTTSCYGATYQWTVSPTHAFTPPAGNTNTITLLSAVPGTYTITVSIRCGNKIVKNQIQVTVKEQKCCSAAFMVGLQELPGGLYQVTATPTCTSENMHYWQLYEANCPSGTYVSGGLNTWLFIPKAGSPTSKWPATSPISANPVGGYGMQYTGLVKPKCYKLTHYFLCCGKWLVQTKCFCLMSSARAHVSDGELNANTVTREVKFDELPAELKQILNSQGQGQQRRD